MATSMHNHIIWCINQEKESKLTEQALLNYNENGEIIQVWGWKKGILDVSPYLEFVQFKELKDENIFNTVKIDGLSISWSNGADICPDELYNGTIDE